MLKLITSSFSIMRLVVLLLVATCTLHGVLGKHYLSALPATNVTCDLGIIHPDTSAQLSNVVSCLEDVSAQEQVDECCPWLLFLDQGACLCSEVLDLNDGADHSRRDSLGRSVRKKGSEGFLEAMRTVCSVTSVNDCSSVATSAPTVTTASPTSTSPTFSPTSASPTASPTATPTTATPTSAAPTVTPTTATPTSAAPTVTTLTPTSAAPTGVPTATPTNPATAAPTATPTNPVTAAPTATTSAPSAVPVAPPPLASRRLLAEPAECANATALQDERVANVQMLSGLMFSEATLLQDLTSALTAILHPNAYLEVYPLGSFQGMEDIAEAVHLLFRPAANRRWVTLERNGTSMVTSSSTANLWVVEDVVDADSTLAQTLPDLLKEDAPPAPAQLAVRGVLRQRVQFGTCGALIGSVTLELPTGLAKRLLDNRSPLKVTCAAAIDACFLAALPGGGTAEERMHWALTNGEFVSVAATAAAAPPFSRAVFEQAVESCVGRAARYGPVDSHCESSAGYRMNAPGKTEMKQGRTSSCDFLNSMLAELNPMKYCMRWMTDHHLNPVGVGYGTYGFHNQRAMCEECYHDVID